MFGPQVKLNAIRSGQPESICRSLREGKMRELCARDMTQARYPIYLDFSNLKFQLTDLSGIEDVNALSLKELTLDSNKIKRLEHLNQFAKLKRLWAQHNLIRFVELTGPFRFLDDLDLSDNKLMEVPDLSNCPSLTRLDLSHNAIRGRLDGIIENTKLTILNLAKNKIKWKDEVFSDALSVMQAWKKLTELSFAGNSCVHLSGWRYFVLQSIGSSLRKLDGKEITADDAHPIGTDMTILSLADYKSKMFRKQFIRANLEAFQEQKRAEEEARVAHEAELAEMEQREKEAIDEGGDAAEAAEAAREARLREAVAMGKVIVKVVRIPLSELTTLLTRSFEKPSETTRILRRVDLAVDQILSAEVGQRVLLDKSMSVVEALEEFVQTISMIIEQGPEFFSPCCVIIVKMIAIVNDGIGRLVIPHLTKYMSADTLRAGGVVSVFRQFLVPRIQDSYYFVGEERDNMIMALAAVAKFAASEELLLEVVPQVCEVFHAEIFSSKSGKRINMHLLQLMVSSAKYRRAVVKMRELKVPNELTTLLLEFKIKLPPLANVQESSYLNTILELCGTTSNLDEKTADFFAKNKIAIPLLEHFNKMILSKETLHIDAVAIRLARLIHCISGLCNNDDSLHMARHKDFTAGLLTLLDPRNDDMLPKLISCAVKAVTKMLKYSSESVIPPPVLDSEGNAIKKSNNNKIRIFDPFATPSSIAIEEANEVEIPQLFARTSKSTADSITANGENTSIATSDQENSTTLPQESNLGSELAKTPGQLDTKESSSQDNVLGTKDFPCNIKGKTLPPNPKAKLEPFNRKVRSQIRAGLHNVVPLLDYLEGPKYDSLFARMKILSQPAAFLTDKDVIEVVSSVIKLCTFYSKLSLYDHEAHEVCMALNESGRDAKLFPFMSCPDDTVKLACVKSFRFNALDEFEDEEIDGLLSVMESCEDLTAGRIEDVLAIVLEKLTEFSDDPGPCGQNFRRYFKRSVITVLGMLLTMSTQDTDGSLEVEKKEKLNLCVACITFLQSASKWSDADRLMRSAQAMRLLRDIILNEETVEPLVPVDNMEFKDKQIENTGLAGTVKSVMTTIENVKAGGSVVSRLFNRISYLMELKHKYGSTFMADQPDSKDMPVRWIRLEAFNEHNAEVAMQERFEQQDSFKREKGIDKVLAILLDDVKVRKLKPLHLVEKALVLAEKRKHDLEDALLADVEGASDDDDEHQHEEEPKKNDNNNTISDLKEESATGIVGGSSDNMSHLSLTMPLVSSLGPPDGKTGYSGPSLPGYQSQTLGSCIRILVCLLWYGRNIYQDEIWKRLRVPETFMKLAYIPLKSDSYASNLGAKVITLLSEIMYLSPKKLEEDADAVVLYEISVQMITELLKNIRKQILTGASLSQREDCLMAHIAGFALQLTDQIGAVSFSDDEVVDDYCDRFLANQLFPVELMDCMLLWLYYDKEVSKSTWGNGSSSVAWRDYTRCYVTRTLSAILRVNEENRYEIIEHINRMEIVYNISLRGSLIAEVFKFVDSLTYQAALEVYMAEQGFCPSERCIDYIWLHKLEEQTIKCKWKKALLVLTNCAWYVLRPSIRKQCSVCTPDKFCPQGPSLEGRFLYDDVKDLIRVSPGDHLFGITRYAEDDSIRTEMFLTSESGRADRLIFNMMRLFAHDHIVALLGKSTAMSSLERLFGLSRNNLIIQRLSSVEVRQNYTYEALETKDDSILSLVGDRFYQKPASNAKQLIMVLVRSPPLPEVKGSESDGRRKAAKATVVKAFICFLREDARRWNDFSMEENESDSSMYTFSELFPNQITLKVESDLHVVFAADHNLRMIMYMPSDPFAIDVMFGSDIEREQWRRDLRLLVNPSTTEDIVLRDSVWNPPESMFSF